MFKLIVTRLATSCPASRSGETCRSLTERELPKPATVTPRRPQIERWQIEDRALARGAVHDAGAVSRPSEAGQHPALAADPLGSPPFAEMARCRG